METKPTTESEFQLALYEQQLEYQKRQNAVMLSNNSEVSLLFLLKKDFGWTDEDIRSNHQWLEKEAEKVWEITTIAETGGVQFRPNKQESPEPLQHISIQNNPDYRWEISQIATKDRARKKEIGGQSLNEIEAILERI